MKGKVVIGDKSIVLIYSLSDLSLILDGKGSTFNFEFFYIPDIGFHFLLVTELCKLILQVEFDEDNCWVRDKQTRQFVKEMRCTS